MDLSKLSNEDLIALKSGDLTKVSDEGLRQLSMGAPAATTKVGLPEIGEGALKVLGYPGNLARGAIGGAYELATGRDDIVNAEDVLKGEAPGFSEMMNKADILQDYPKTRGVVGFGLDVATDPLTYLAGPISAAAKAEKAGLGIKALNAVVNPVEALGRGLERGGSAIYKSAFDKADRELATRYGKESIADILKAERFKGGMDEAALKADEINKAAGEELGALREYAGNLGKMGTPSDLSRAEEVVKEYASSKIPSIKKIGSDLRDELESIKLGTEPMYPSEAAAQKKTLRDIIGGDSAFDAAKSAPERAQKRFNKALMSSYSEAENQAMGKLPEQEYQLYQELKKKYGATSKFIQNKLQKEGTKELNRTGVMPSALDTAFGTLALATADKPGLAALAAKKGRDILRMTPVKTRLGLGMEDLGVAAQNASPYMSQAVRDALWIEMLKNDQGDQK
jgi:hypothetical protein